MSDYEDLNHPAYQLHLPFHLAEDPRPAFSVTCRHCGLVISGMVPYRYHILMRHPEEARKLSIAP